MQWNTPDVKQMNMEKIRKEIMRTDKCTKAEIARRTGLSVATCNSIINEMLEKKELILSEQANSPMGRPAALYEYDHNFQHVLGVAVHSGGKDFVEYAIGDAVGNVIKREHAEERVITDDSIAELIRMEIEQDPLIRCVSVGIPGVIDKGRIALCDISELNDVMLEEELKERFGVDCVVYNDMDLITRGVYEKRNSKDAGLAVILFPAYGTAFVGAGFAINGRVLRGSTHFSGELSYVAEAFGYTRSEMLEVRNDPMKYLQYIAQTIVVAIATFDPVEIILMGKEFRSERIAQIRAACTKIIPPSHVPEMSGEDDVNGAYISGLMTASLNRIDFPLLEPMYVDMAKR